MTLAPWASQDKNAIFLNKMLFLMPQNLATWLGGHWKCYACDRGIEISSIPVSPLHDDCAMQCWRQSHIVNYALHRLVMREVCLWLKIKVSVLFTIAIPTLLFIYLFQSVTNNLLHSQFAMQTYALHQVDLNCHTRGGLHTRRIIRKQLMHGSACNIGFVCMSFRSRW